MAIKIEITEGEMFEVFFNADIRKFEENCRNPIFKQRSHAGDTYDLLANIEALPKGIKLETAYRKLLKYRHEAQARFEAMPKSVADLKKQIEVDGVMES